MALRKTKVRAHTRKVKSKTAGKGKAGFVVVNVKASVRGGPGESKRPSWRFKTREWADRLPPDSVFYEVWGDRGNADIHYFKTFEDALRYHRFLITRKLDVCIHALQRCDDGSDEQIDTPDY